MWLHSVIQNYVWDGHGLVMRSIQKAHKMLSKFRIVHSENYRQN